MCKLFPPLSYCNRSARRARCRRAQGLGPAAAGRRQRDGGGGARHGWGQSGARVGPEWDQSGAKVGRRAGGPSWAMACRLWPRFSAGLSPSGRKGRRKLPPPSSKSPTPLTPKARPADGDSGTGGRCTPLSFTGVPTLGVPPRLDAMLLRTRGGGGAAGAGWTQRSPRRVSVPVHRRIGASAHQRQQICAVLRFDAR